jgi:branched-chain amino acid aminotransferase
MDQAVDLAQRNGHAQFGRIRLTVFRGAGGLFDPEHLHPNFLIETWSLPEHFTEWTENGLVLGIASQVAKSPDVLANLKHNNYLAYALAAMEAKANQWNDALVLNTARNLADSTIANLFLVEGTRFVTPPLTDGPVAGVRRRHLIEFIRASGGEVLEASISPERLLQANEVFLTNAIRPIRWVQRIENESFGNEQTYALYLRYRATIS